MVSIKFLQHSSTNFLVVFFLFWCENTRVHLGIHFFHVKIIRNIFQVVWIQLSFGHWGGSLIEQYSFFYGSWSERCSIVFHVMMFFGECLCHINTHAVFSISIWKYFIYILFNFTAYNCTKRWLTIHWTVKRHDVCLAGSDTS